MILCSCTSSHQSDRGQDLEAIIWAGESLCPAGLLLLHIAPQNTNTFFSLESIEFTDPPTPQEFSITLSPSPSPVGIQMQQFEQVLSQGSLSSSQLICL